MKLTTLDYADGKPPYDGPACDCGEMVKREGDQCGSCRSDQADYDWDLIRDGGLL